jgi:hypothetical protein
MSPSPIRSAYDMWPQYQARLRTVIANMSPQDLSIRPSPDRLPIWATTAHVANVRVYWICDVIGEPGAEDTPFGGRDGDGWEDHLDHPRGTAELVEALDSTWRIVDRCLDAWTVEMLADVFERPSGASVQRHTRGSIMQRLLTHEAYHCGELSQTLGIEGLPQIDLWGPAPAL